MHRKPDAHLDPVLRDQKWPRAQSPAGFNFGEDALLFVTSIEQRVDYELQTRRVRCNMLHISGDLNPL